MSNIEKVKAEIERRKEELERDKYININAKTCRQSELKYLERFIDSLSEEPDKSLNEEVKRYYSDNFAYISSDQPTLSILTNIARHFAEWGADHLRDSTKMEDKSLEEAAREIVIKMHPCLKDCTILGDRLTRGRLMALVKAGAEWMNNQMPMPEDTVIFQKGVEEGRRLEREEWEENKRKEDELPRFYGD